MAIYDENAIITTATTYTEQHHDAAIVARQHRITCRRNQIENVGPINILTAHSAARDAQQSGVVSGKVVIDRIDVVIDRPDGNAHLARNVIQIECTARSGNEVHDLRLPETQPHAPDLLLSARYDAGPFVCLHCVLLMPRRTLPILANSPAPFVKGTVLHQTACTNCDPRRARRDNAPSACTAAPITVQAIDRTAHFGLPTWDIFLLYV